MSFLSRPSTTSALLTVIAVLLLILVVQNASQKKTTGMPAATAGNPHAGSTFKHPSMSGGSSQGSMAQGDPEDVDMASMIFASFICPEESMLTLADPGCKNQEADMRRTEIRKAMDAQLPIRQLYDRMVEKFGENSLTKQAKAIRRSNRQP